MWIERYRGDSMKRMFLFFSHHLTGAQIEDAQKNYAIEEFVALPKELQPLWSQIDPDIPTLKERLKPLFGFLSKEAKKGDYTLIQGDFGAVYLMVNYVKKLGVIPVYATTKREAYEYIDASGKLVKKSIFKHRRFREYE